MVSVIRIAIHEIKNGKYQKGSARNIAVIGDDTADIFDLVLDILESKKIRHSYMIDSERRIK
jgi:hypothetical protein